MQETQRNQSKASSPPKCPSKSLSRICSKRYKGQWWKTDSLCWPSEGSGAACALEARRQHQKWRWGLSFSRRKVGEKIKAPLKKNLWKATSLGKFAACNLLLLFSFYTTQQQATNGPSCPEPHWLCAAGSSHLNWPLINSPQIIFKRF